MSTLQFQKQVPRCTMCHCPGMWVPKEYGCHISEDEIGIISLEMFSDTALFSMGHTPEEDLMAMLDLAEPESRYLFEFYCRESLDEAKAIVARFRERFPREQACLQAS